MFSYTFFLRSDPSRRTCYGTPLGFDTFYQNSIIGADSGRVPKSGEGGRIPAAGAASRARVMVLDGSTFNGTLGSTFNGTLQSVPERQFGLPCGTFAEVPLKVLSLLMVLS